MKKIMLTIANYRDDRQFFFDQHFKPRNQRFANTHGYEYRVISKADPFGESRGGNSWVKFKIILDMIKEGELKEGDFVFHVDADARIDKFDLDFPCEKSVSFSIDSGNTLNGGVFKLRVNDWSKRLMENILDESLWSQRKDDPLWKMWWEQAAIYDLFGMPRNPRHPPISLFTTSNYGWNMSVNQYTKYGLGELRQNVQIVGTEWNVTLLEGESTDLDPDPTLSYLMMYNINKVTKDQVRIRHFAAGQKWKTNYELSDVSDQNTILFKNREEQVRHHLRSGMVGAEIGVFTGDFSQILLSTNPSKLHLVDLFEGTHSSGDKDGRNMQTVNLGESFKNLTERYSGDNRVSIFRGASTSFLSSIEDNSLDFIYIDADHTYDGVRADMNLSFGKLKSGGLMMGHDYACFPNSTWKFHGVVRAVNEFCKERNQVLSSLSEDGCPSFCIEVLK